MQTSTAASPQIINLASLSGRALNVLLVEDCATERLLAQTHLENFGYTPTSVKNGKEAVEILTQNPNKFDFIVMDRMMPILDGIKATQLIKQHPALKYIPIIMVSAADSFDEMHEGIKAGIFHYLSKPIQAQTFQSVLLAISRQVAQRRMLNIQMRRHRINPAQHESYYFEFTSLQEAENISSFMAQFFPTPERAVSGLAELMINAVEHGLYEIGYSQKTELLNTGNWQNEIANRQAQLKFSGRKASAILTRKHNSIYVTISDNGAGFSWQNYLKLCPTRAGDNHGRGIAYANLASFDTLSYNKAGNTVTVYAGDPITTE